jgi:hypothetical protein
MRLHSVLPSLVFYSDGYRPTPVARKELVLDCLDAVELCHGDPGATHHFAALAWYASQ